MSKILYVDKELNDEDSFLRNKSLGLIEKLRLRGFEVDVVDDKMTFNEFFVLTLLNRARCADYEERFERMIERLRGYNVFVAHLGVNSPPKIQNFLERIPHLRAALVSDSSHHYEVEGRMGIFDYDSEEIFSWIGQ